MDGICVFCGEHKRLHESHVLPAFVYRWLKGRSGTGYIRETGNPNVRVQDGLKLRWLCGDCERRFGRYETAFATKVFHPWNAGSIKIPYQDWLLKFCVSISWRVLRYAKGYNREAEYTPEQEVLMQQAEMRWHAFLRDEVPHPAAFEQHLLIADVIEDTNIPHLPVNINRFMTGAVTLDIVGSQRSLLTFAKLGGFMIFGVIQRGPNRWEGTRVHVKQGVLKPEAVTIPIGLLDLFKAKAEHSAESMDKMSTAQRDKVENVLAGNPERFVASKQFAAMEADVRMFGLDAALWKDRS